MEAHRQTILWLIATLLCSQWLAIAHAAEHPALQVDAACSICLIAQATDCVADPGASQAIPPCEPVELTPAHATPAADAGRSQTFIRGPPRLIP